MHLQLHLHIPADGQKFLAQRGLKVEKNSAKRTLAVAHAQLISNSKFKIDICKILQNSTLDF